MGGWSARGSHTRTRVAVRVISNLQRLVKRALIERPNADPLAEEETILQFESFMCEKGVGPENSAKCFKQLGKDSVSIPVARTSELAVEEMGPLNSSEVPETEQLAEMAQDEPRADKRLKSESCRTQVLGDNPKEVRDCARRLLEPGYYVSASGRSATRLLHFLGDCYMIPGIDYFRYQYLGQLVPSISEFDGVCKLCSKKGSVRVHESSGTETSSSTSQGGI